MYGSQGRSYWTNVAFLHWGQEKRNLPSHFPVRLIATGCCNLLCPRSILFWGWGIGDASCPDTISFPEAPGLQQKVELNRTSSLALNGSRYPAVAPGNLPSSAISWGGQGACVMVKRVSEMSERKLSRSKSCLPSGSSSLSLNSIGTTLEKSWSHQFSSGFQLLSSWTGKRVGCSEALWQGVAQVDTCLVWEVDPPRQNLPSLRASTPFCHFQTPLTCFGLRASQSRLDLRSCKKNTKGRLHWQRENLWVVVQRPGLEKFNWLKNVSPSQWLSSQFTQTIKSSINKEMQKLDLNFLKRHSKWEGELTKFLDKEKSMGWILDYIFQWQELFFPTSSPLALHEILLLGTGDLKEWYKRVCSKKRRVSGNSLYSNLYQLLI